MSIRFLTAGESHGKALVGILEGMPAGIDIDFDEIRSQMLRRKLGHGRGERQTIEDDAVELISGIRHGKTLGSPISILIKNRDWKNWETIMQTEPTKDSAVSSNASVTVPRPGHADLPGAIKYGHSDIRNVLERASARETAIRVALGTIARLFLKQLAIHIASRVVQIGSIVDTSPCPIAIDEVNTVADESPVRCLDPTLSSNMVTEIQNAIQKGDTVGGIFEVVASGIPIGLGSYRHWDKRLEGDIGKHFLSLNGIKGVEIGLGFKAASLTGSQVHDELYPAPQHFKSNRSGGINGGVSTGKPIIIRAAMKPIATLPTPLNSFDLQTNSPKKAHVERSDTCAVPAASVIGESLLAFVLTKHLIEKFGSDSMNELIPRVEDWRKATTKNNAK